jgi:protein SDA1
LAIDSALLQDLTQYKNHREKSVMMAARSLITLFRELNPEMLMKKDRGKTATVRLKDGTVKVVHFGETNDGLDGLQGVELLDEEGNEGKEDDGWDNWEVDEDSDSDDGDDWINVPSDNEEEFDIDMDDDDKTKSTNAEEGGEAKPKRRIGKRQLRKMLDELKDEPLTEEQQKKLTEEMELRRAEEQKKQEAVLKMATTRILTPADFARLEELRQAKESGDDTTAAASAAKKRSAAAAADDMDDGQIDEYAILGPRKKMKQDYEARMASIQEGREGREKFGSKKGNKDRGSTTNREKARNKNFQMVSQKSSVLWKSKRSLFDKQKSLRAAITKQKKRKH